MTRTISTGHTNGKVVSVRAAAGLLRSRGFALCKPDPGTKNPTDPGWPTRSLEPDDFAPGDLIGILGGPLSDGGRPGHAAVHIDLDSAAAIKAADPNVRGGRSVSRQIPHHTRIVSR
jgi:hypothetical protein